MKSNIYQWRQKKNYVQGSRLTGRTFATNFLSWSNKHIIWSQLIFFMMQDLINQCMLINLYHSL